MDSGEQCCGNCGWWDIKNTIKGDDCLIALCMWNPSCEPDSLMGIDLEAMRDDSGITCPCWKPR